MTATKDLGNQEKLLKNDEKSKNVPTGEFEAPDGGWGWMIVVAAGFANFCILPMAQAFGLIFRDRFLQLGINASQITTIMNVNNAVTSCIGLANGPLFRKYSYRQIAFAGGTVTAFSICCLAYATTFQTVFLFYSILYGSGLGIAASSCALALNTYFKKRRRIATGFSWTCTGLGPIIMPQIITILMPIYGISGTVLLYGGFALNSVACALLLQPVEWHVKTKKAIVQSPEPDNIQEKAIEASNEPTKNGKAISVENILRQDRPANLVDNSLSQRFGSQYLYYDDKEVGAAGIDVVASGTPMMSRANDGWFSNKNSSHASLTSGKSLKRETSQSRTRTLSLSLSRPPSIRDLGGGNSVRNLNNDVDGFKRVSYRSTNLAPLEDTNELRAFPKIEPITSETTERENPEESAQKELLAMEDPWTDQGMREMRKPWYVRAARAIVVFFDLDLLRDPVYVNLMLGLSFANFTELNFALLTPFILGEYGFEKPAVATVMSVLGGVDVSMRIVIPFIATPIGLQNRTYFLIGVGSMAAGRVILAHVRSYGVVLGVAVIIGAGKALRTIFMALVIPTHVPLRRLPAASGLQLLVSGIVFLTLGPLVGWIRDFSGNYTVTLHCLNILTYLTAISWTIEVCYCNRKQKRDSAFVAA